jgi:hypothetical protein
MRSTIDPRAGGAVRRVMAQLVGWGLSIAGRNFTHNAGVGSSSLPPATLQMMLLIDFSLCGSLIGGPLSLSEP